MADQFIGEIRAFGFNFAPYEWAFCNGQALPTQQNPALYAVIGTFFGGNTTNFNLPNLGGRGAVGQIGGVLNNPVGDTTVTITSTTMPSHNHTLIGDIARATAALPTGHLPSRFLDANNCAFVPYTAPLPPVTTLAQVIVSPVGSGQPHDNSQPYQVVNFCISLAGAWPERP